MLDNLRVNPIINPIRGANMSNNKNVEQLKDKAADLGTDIKHQVKEAQLSGEKTLDDLKHSAKEVKLEAEKKLDESTRLYSLADLRGIRNTADFAKEYLAGMYGALPVLEDFKSENLDSNE